MQKQRWGDRLELQVGVFIAVASLVISYLAFSLNKQKETKTETRQDARIQAQLEYIGKGVDDIRIDLKANKDSVSELKVYVARVEESNKSLHKRVDKLEGKGEVLHG
jgi:hypothetical protein